MEKLIKEHEDKLQDSDKEPLNKAIEKAREAAKGDDVQSIKSAIEELEQASHALSKTLYESSPGEATAAPGGDAGDNGDDAPVEDDAIDAEFEVKND
jgi:molecular chaperone DnaK